LDHAPAADGVSSATCVRNGGGSFQDNTAVSSTSPLPEKKIVSTESVVNHT